MATGGRIIPNSGHAGMSYLIKAFVRSVFVRQQGRPFLSASNQKDLLVLKGLIEDGKLAPVIDRTFALSETAEALRYIGDGHARGKVVIIVPGAEQRAEAAARQSHQPV
jgi:NADPH:quinone reductase-like Zn-dependent oxidoreductase